MTRKLYVIYIPGLGDDNPSGQRLAVRTWRLWRVHAELFQMKWSDRIAWEAKYRKLIERIDELHTAGHQVALVGASAGASAAINVFAARKHTVAGIVVIAGKINRPEAVSRAYRQNNPSFIESLLECQASLGTLNSQDRAKILSRYAIYDEIVSSVDSIVPGAVNRVRYIPGHVPMIATQIFFGAPSFLRFLKKQAKVGQY